MTTRRIGLATLVSVALFAIAVAFSLRADAEGTNPLLVDDVAQSYEVAIAPVEPTEPLEPPQLIGFQAPEPTLIANPTPVAPPQWIEIPSDLITAPLATEADAIPLPMLATIASAARSDAAVYLTFDDGPDPVYTNQILDVLNRYGARATFYVLGSAVDSHPEVVQRIVAEGHALGNHTYYHEALPLETDEHIVQTLAATNNAIARATGRTTTCMRPPYGSLDERTLQIIHGQGYNVSMWEVDSSDWKLASPYDIAAGVLRDTNLGDRVLFHDGPANRSSTVAALESVLAVLSERGVTFAALPC